MSDKHYIIRLQDEITKLKSLVKAGEDEELARKQSENWIKIDKEVNTTGDELLTKLRHDFQKIIGLE